MHLLIILNYSKINTSELDFVFNFTQMFNKIVAVDGSISIVVSILDTKWGT